ncbi:hypothetical protein ES288_A03G174500v1 [Gossypium darwinii]|uniref:Uncharacterized protein n=2 Tax=Gossypium TaxID=3633 RepID=A0A5D2RAL0_GOSTO|nr:hypothetical protein ES288_A03G174500v1 [Gossypium darwinii]TYI36840.1 hypothetical protein ES332_A03G169400v1 [Gossypium tomentosum]
MTEFFGTTLIYFWSHPSLSNPRLIPCPFSFNQLHHRNRGFLHPVFRLFVVPSCFGQSVRSAISQTRESPSTQLCRKPRSSPNMTTCKHAQASAIAGVAIFLLGPCRILIVKLQSRNKWATDSTSNLHNGHRSSLTSPLLFKLWSVCINSLDSFHIPIFILLDNFSFHNYV